MRLLSGTAHGLVTKLNIQLCQRVLGAEGKGSLGWWGLGSRGSRCVWSGGIQMVDGGGVGF